VSARVVGQRFGPCAECVYGNIAKGYCRRRAPRVGPEGLADWPELAVEWDNGDHRVVEEGCGEFEPVPMPAAPIRIGTPDVVPTELMPLADVICTSCGRSRRGQLGPRCECPEPPQNASDGPGGPNAEHGPPDAPGDESGGAVAE
jgi:hypothetical protein